MLADTVETVLVPLDGSEFSRRALPYAALVAARLGATVHLLSAVADEDEVAAREADLLDNPAFQLVVSSHARTGLSQIVFGSVAAAIVHHSTAPVLVVPRPDAR